MATLAIGLKVLSRYQTLFCCLVIVWAVGIIVGSIFLAAWGSSKKSSYVTLSDVHVALKERAILNYNNPKVLRALKYCSPLLHGANNQFAEGNVEEKHHLEAVIMVMRHGDRGPMQPFRNLSLINCGVASSHESQTANYTNYMEKHGGKRSSRDPFRHFPLLPKNSSCFPGHLTQWGVSQQLQTGSALSNIYIKRLHLLRRDWRPEEVVIISTMMERTYQSAISFAYGFLPDFDITKLNVKIGLGATFCYSQQLCRCPLIDKLKRSVDSEKYSLLSLHEAVQELVDQADAILRFQKVYSGNPVRPDDVFDKLLVYVCHRTNLPCYHEGACVTVDQLANVISFLEWRGKRLSESSKVKLLSRLSMQGFFTDLLQRLTDLSVGKKKSRFVLYSAHDNTLMPLMLSMGVYDGVRPPYSARLIFELHSFIDETRKKIYHIKIIYNGKDITRRAPFCCRKPMKLGAECRYCLFSSFAKFVEKDYLKELNSTSFRQACLNSGLGMEL